jgi:hypothetical protein
MLTVEDWISAGYKRFDQVAARQYAAFGLQKRFDDDKGKQYYITVFVYHNKEFMLRFPDMHPFTFEPECQFMQRDSITVNTTLLIHKNSSIAEVEAMVHKLWVALGKPYYEIWND